ncbi:hypothetical protein [Hespellia stercorisuis]|uniref:Uncharacterized protein n=1 Tax=Hespellia stercorisuis DSM 15480 TaxID=1121950 RepID=A0A1M6RFJ5_9FIRM|nr:hypothetical protein [Hespellia stercorisuis]SHK31261.1 hypothetical protein SAMN02745243_02682 [Hespellia stercorisuis DSM 15480]
MKKLNDYVDEILRKNHTDEEWRFISQEVDKLYKTATENEIKTFENSGAGDTLGMILEYM